jgi:hypothetical protein
MALNAYSANFEHLAKERKGEGILSLMLTDLVEAALG